MALVFSWDPIGIPIPEAHPNGLFGGGSMASTRLSNKAYKYLQELITLGELKQGTVISERQVAETLGISRTPVADAVNRLASQGLLEQIPRYGTVVRTIARKEIEEAYELREAIEPYAALKAASKVSKPQLEQLGVFCDAMEQLAEQLKSSCIGFLDDETFRRFLAIDKAFHIAILYAAANNRMLRVVQDSRAIANVFCIRRRPHRIGIVLSACDLHRKILTAICDSDGECAAGWMLRRIRQSKQETLVCIEHSEVSSVPIDFLSLGVPDDVQRQLEALQQDDS